MILHSRTYIEKLRAIEFNPRLHVLAEKESYFLWEQRGCPVGSPEVDWFRACRELVNTWSKHNHLYEIALGTFHFENPHAILHS